MGDVDLRDAHKVLRVLQANWCQYPNAQGLPEDTVELYLRMLTETNSRGEHLRDFADAMEATRHWMLSEDHFPLVGELLDAIQREARKRAAASAPALPPAWAGLDPDDLPPADAPMGPLDKAARLEQIRELKAMLKQVGRPAPSVEHGARPQQ